MIEKMERSFRRGGVEVRVDGRIALVTGASQGVGQAVAEALARAGAGGLLLTGRDSARGEAVAERLRGSGTAAQFVAADLADVEAPARLVEACLARFVASTRWSTPRVSPTAPASLTRRRATGGGSSTSTPARRSF
jgi:NAD(P)-dependent dehydrogenase (short-subunit alcohol dehydrogenase family)